MLDKENIFRQLQALQVPRDRPVTVHSSLRAVGATDGDGDDFLQILIDWVTLDNGLLCIPTHTWHRLWQTDVPTLDLNDSKTCIGTLPDLAAARKDGYRSLNPTHSVVVFGNREKAESFIAGEEKLESPVSAGGVYAKFADCNGYVLLIGVGMNRNTFLHAAENGAGFPNRLTENVMPTSIRLKDGTILPCPMRQIDAKGLPDVSQRYPKFEPAFRYYGCIRDGKIGNADSMLCDAKEMLRVMAIIRQRSNGFELLADDVPLAEELYI